MSELRVAIRPRYGEVDSMGVVYHAHYLAYFDVARTELMRSRGVAYSELETRGYRLVVVDVAVRYRAPARYDEPLEVAVWLTAVGRASVRFDYALHGPAGLLATGHTRLGCLDTDHRPTPLPDDAFAALRSSVRPGRIPSTVSSEGS